MHIAMIAAENGALTGGKVGGIGDVIRDVPLALAAMGHVVSVLTPGYQSLAQRNPSTLLVTLDVPFCGKRESVALFQVEPVTNDLAAGPAPETGSRNVGSVTHYVLESPIFAACGEGAIYCDDQCGPFATDAHKFALFCAAACKVLTSNLIAGVELLHLHDWHAAMLAILRRYMPDARSLLDVPVVFTIHNLSLQGVRPLSGHRSSLHSWFASLAPDLGLIQDPVHWDCVNLMRAGINLADRVHAVSPSYAEEILQPTEHSRGFIGGEGLEKDLQRVSAEGRLRGILNGCDYNKKAAPHRSRAQLWDLIEDSLLAWVGKRHFVPAAHFYAQLRVAQWRRRRRPVPYTLTSVGRITGQKARLFLEQVSDGRGGEINALDRLLQELGDGVFIMIGSGDEHYEQFFTASMARHDNFMFLQGFSEELADALYAAGDLFLMPSSFEPCGISQMLAMRGGTPCIVHHVGGLRDTVTTGVNGFTFVGEGFREQAENMLETVQHACLSMSRPATWQTLRRGALTSRFTWEESVRRYCTELYKPSL